MWKLHFNFVKLKPGKVVTALLGEINFSADTIGIEIIKTLYENGFPYLEIMEEGKAILYGTETFMGKDSTTDKPIQVKKQGRFIRLYKDCGLAILQIFSTKVYMKHKCSGLHKCFYVARQQPDC